MPEVTASCYIQSIGTNMLFIKNTTLDSYDRDAYHIVVCIKGMFCSHPYRIPLSPLDAEYGINDIKHAFENGLVSVEDTSHHINNLFYSTVIDGQREYLHRCDLSRHNHIEAFATRKKWLFKKLEEQGNPILK